MAKCIFASPSISHIKHSSYNPKVCHSRQTHTKLTGISLQLTGQRQRNLKTKCGTSTEVRKSAGNRMLVFVPPHPLIKHWVSVLRNEETPSPVFRSAMAELGRLLIYEAAREWLPTVSGDINTPLAVAPVEFIDPREPVLIVPILRAGLALVEHAATLLPASKTYHVGFLRDETTLLPSLYLNKLPDKIQNGTHVLVADPMLATGGTMIATLNILRNRGVENNKIRVVSAIAGPPALQRLSQNFPGLHVYVGAIDPTVNDQGFIVPGLGDAGDRCFGT